MKRLRIHVVLLLLGICAGAAAQAAGVHRLTPADPQPDESRLKSGLAVKYAYPGDIQSLGAAESWRSQELQDGPPLVGFDYPDTLPGEPTLTSSSDEFVIAFINGYMKLDRPGTYLLEFHSNDGLRVRLGGVQVYEYDLRHPCESLGPETVEVPSAGWYEVEALFFQRKNTSCLLLNWQPPGQAFDWAPVDIYAHIPE